MGKVRSSGRIFVCCPGPQNDSCVEIKEGSNLNYRRRSSSM